MSHDYPSSPATFHYTQYRSGDAQRIAEVIAAYPLALITSYSGTGGWVSSHVPLFHDPADASRLLGHADMANLHFADPEAGSASGMPVQVIFRGPDRYIPPRAYATRQLPTWNYIAVHVDGVLTVEDSDAAKRQILALSAEQLEPDADGFRLADDDPRIPPLLPLIRGLTIRVRSIEGRFKLSQDKSREDVLAAARHLLDADGGAAARNRRTVGGLLGVEGM